MYQPVLRAQRADVSRRLPLVSAGARRTLGCALGVVAAVALLACSPTQRAGLANHLAGPDEPAVLFIAQNAIPNAFMEALFQGRVTLDPAGCLRTESMDRHTVVWPKGFSLDEGGLLVLDSLGAAVGRIGGSFRLGGGEVASLHDGIALSAADRQRAESRCPGRYWIVGQMPEEVSSEPAQPDR